MYYKSLKKKERQKASGVATPIRMNDVLGLLVRQGIVWMLMKGMPRRCVARAFAKALVWTIEKANVLASAQCV